MLRDLTGLCWFAFKWGLLAAVAATIGVGLYLYSHLNDQIRQRVEAKLAAQYPDLEVTVRAAQLVDGKGIEVRGLLIADPQASGPQAELAYFDELFLSCQTTLADLLQHEPEITGMLVRRPRLHAVRLADGSWNLSQLLPLPKFSDRPPDMSIEGGELLVFDATPGGRPPWRARDINLEIKPDSAGEPDSEICEVQGYLTADHVERVELKGRIDRATGNAEIAGSVAGIDVSPELLAALPADWAARLRPLAPLRGQGRLSFQVARRGQSPPQFNVAGELVSGRFDDARLPQALADMRAKFRADNSGFVLDELTARNGPTAIRLSGRMDGFQPGAAMYVEGEGQHLLIGRQWEAILPEMLLVQWRKFLPAGEVHISGRAVFDGQRWQPDVTVRCLNVSFTYHKFPYRLERGTGEITLKGNQLDLHLDAFAGGRKVDVDGQFFNPGPRFTGAVELRGADVPVDQNLYAALPEKSRGVLESLNPTGTFNFWARVWRDDPAQQQMNQHMAFTVNRCSVRYDKFPYPLGNITGKIEMINGQWYFRELQGTNDTGVVNWEGHFTPAAEGANLFVKFHGRDVVLDEELRDALTPPMQRLWNDVQPRGAINLDAEVNYRTADKQLAVTTRIEPVADKVSIHPAFFPYRLERLSGAITFRDGRADFENLCGLHDRTAVSTNGFCEHAPDGRWHVRFADLTVDRIDMERDGELTAALPGKLRKAVVQLNPTGMIGMRGTLDLWGESLPAADSVGECRVRSAWNVEFDLQQATLQTGLDLQNVHGNVTLAGQCDGVKAWSSGELNLDSVTWRGFQFTDIRGPLWLDDNQVIVGAPAEQQQAGRGPRRLSAKCYGGVVLADARVSLEAMPRYSVQAVISDGDLARFCTEALPGRQTIKGKVVVAADLNGSAAGLHTLNGQGELRMRDADIYELPVMVALLKVLNLRRPDTTAFTTSKVLFRIDGEHIVLENIEFSGDAISLIGKGEMNFNTDIKLTLHSVVGRSDIQLPVWKTLVGGASEQIMQIHVTGTLANPQTRREAFPSITQALQSIQASMQPQERTVFPEGVRLFQRPDDPQRR